MAESVEYSEGELIVASSGRRIGGANLAQDGTYERGSTVTVSVLDKGAVGGNEALDTAAFVAAIAAAGVNGRVQVPWPASKLPYIVTPGVLAALDGTNLEAKGWYPKIQKGTGTGFVYTALGVIRPRIAGIHWIGSSSKAGPSVSGDGGVLVQGCNEPTVEDNEIEGMAWDALACSTWANRRPTVRRNWVHDSANHGITCTSGKGYTAGTATAVPTTQDAVVCDNVVWNVGNFGIICGYSRNPTVSIDVGIDAHLVNTAAGVNPPNMVSTDPGLEITIPGAGPAAADLYTTISSWVDATHVRITDAASTTVVNVEATVYSLGQRYRVHNNASWNTGGPGIQLFMLDGLEADDNRADNCPTGFLFSYLRHSTVNNPKASHSSPTSSYGCAMYENNCDDLTVNNPEVYDVDNLSGGAGEGIRFISNGPLALPIHCNRPTVGKTASHGIEVLASDVYIDGHSVSGAGTGTGGTSGWGVYLNACTRPHVTNGRRTEGNVSGGITASGAVISPNVVNNDISNVAAAGANPPAINLSATSTNGRWMDNNIHNIGTGKRYQGAGGAGTVVRDRTNNGFFGDGVDGAIVFDGAATIILADGSTLVPAANVYTLARDIFPTTCTVNAGVTLKTASFGVFCSLLFDNEGTVDNSGLAASGAVAGGAAAIGTLVTGGGAGATGAAALSTGATAATPGSNANMGGPGGGGGGSGTAATGAAGAVTDADGWTSKTGGTGGTAGTSGAAGGPGGAVNLLATRGPLHHFPQLAMGVAISGPGGVSAVGPGAGGGAGAGDGTNAGGAGGGGAGVVLIAAPILISNGSIFARGGVGGAAAGGDAGGGGGGGGGVILLVANSMSVGTASVTGGAGGAKAGGGTAGHAGGAGTVIKQTLAA